MSGVRWMPILGVLAVMALVPGALADCYPGHQESGGGGFNTQSTAGPALSPVLVVALVGLPLIVLGAVGAAVRGTPAAATSVSGRWVATPSQWLWVPDKK